eukprot:6475590-Amphidinium_carterae.2
MSSVSKGVHNFSQAANVIKSEPSVLPLSLINIQNPEGKKLKPTTAKGRLSVKKKQVKHELG